MKNIETMSIKKFMETDFKKLDRQRRIEKTIKTVVISGVVCTVIIYSLLDPNLAIEVSADTGYIDEKANSIYKKLLTFGKWVIIIKGAIDTINQTVQGDSPAARKSFLSYLIVYVILNGLPWAMHEVDVVFSDM